MAHTLLVCSPHSVLPCLIVQGAHVHCQCIGLATHHYGTAQVTLCNEEEPKANQLGQGSALKLLDSA